MRTRVGLTGVFVAPSLVLGAVAVMSAQAGSATVFVREFDAVGELTEASKTRRYQRVVGAMNLRLACPFLSSPTVSNSRSPTNLSRAHQYPKS
jgi:hypothetical protein